MGEKERARQEIERIEGNKSLTRADKNRAIKQVKGLTRTIDGLIDREKDKISEHYESQLASQIRMSTLQQNQGGTQQTFHNQQELFALARTEEDEVKNSGSFNLKASLGMSDDSALREQRPLLREDIQFDDFKKKAVMTDQNYKGKRGVAAAEPLWQQQESSVLDYEQFEALWSQGGNKAKEISNYLVTANLGGNTLLS